MKLPHMVLERVCYDVYQLRGPILLLVQPKNKRTFAKLWLLAHEKSGFEMQHDIEREIYIKALYSRLKIHFNSELKLPSYDIIQFIAALARSNGTKA